MLILRPSGMLEYLKCPRAYYLIYKVVAGPTKQPLNLFFGSALHKTLEAYLKEEILPRQMVEFFQHVWETRLPDMLKE